MLEWMASQNYYFFGWAFPRIWLINYYNPIAKNRPNVFIFPNNDPLILWWHMTSKNALKWNINKYHRFLSRSNRKYLNINSSNTKFFQIITPRNNNQCLNPLKLYGCIFQIKNLNRVPALKLVRNVRHAIEQFSCSNREYIPHLDT